MTPLVDSFRGVLLVTRFLLPGWGYARALRCPLPGFAAAVFSTLALFTDILPPDAFHLAITVLSLGWWLLVVTVVGCGFARQSRSRASPAPNAPAPSPPLDGSNAWLAAPALLLVFVAVWRAVAQRLSGVDTAFRWDRLAQLITTHGHLAYYPATTSADDTLYFWANGSAPLVSSALAWS